MNQRKVFIIVYFLAGLLSAACGGAVGTGPRKTPVREGATAAPIEVPEEVSVAERRLWEKTLFLLPADHPSRRELRDRIAVSLAREFAAVDASKLQQRLDLFTEGLHLHEPVDFTSGSVAEALVPMARWAADTFSERGEEAVVLASLRYLMIAEPKNDAYRERYLALLEWSQSVRETVVDKLQRFTSLIDMFTEMIELVPDMEVARKVAALHVERYQLVQAVFQGGGDYELTDPRQIVMHGRAVQNMPLNVIHIFFLVGDLSLARGYLEDLVADGSLSVGYLELLDRIELGDDLADAYYSLAGSLAYFDPRASLRAYILARRAASDDHRISMSIGLLFDELDCSECAVDFYVETVSLNPSEEVTTKVLSLVNRSLERLHYAENSAACERVIHLADGLVADALAAFPDEDTELRTAAAALLYAMGEVGFDDGRPGDAERHLRLSYKAQPNVPSLIKLQDLYYLLGRYEEAMAAIESAGDVEMDGNDGADYLQALVTEKRADILRAQGRNGEAEALYREALEQFESGGELTDGSPSTAVQRGFILHRLGDVEGSQDAFLLAIRLDPDRAETYGTLISFLVMEGRLEDAVAVYRLAYNQDRIKGMWKTYYSLWVEGLSRRTGKGSVPLAKGYLASSNGDSWQDRLAMYFVDKITFDELRKSAANQGQQVETDYYGAVLALSNGKKSEAKKLLDAVIASNLLGFFEYRMARDILDKEFGAQESTRP